MPCAFTCMLVRIAKCFKMKIDDRLLTSKIPLTDKIHANFNNDLQSLLFFGNTQSLLFNSCR